jgi:hypothetical protein
MACLSCVWRYAKSSRSNLATRFQEHLISWKHPQFLKRRRLVTVNSTSTAGASTLSYFARDPHEPSSFLRAP